MDIVKKTKDVKQFNLKKQINKKKSKKFKYYYKIFYLSFIAKQGVK